MTLVALSIPLSEFSDVLKMNVTKYIVLWNHIDDYRVVNEQFYSVNIVYHMTLRILSIYLLF